MKTGRGREQQAKLRGRDINQVVLVLEWISCFVGEVIFLRIYDIGTHVKGSLGNAL